VRDLAIDGDGFVYVTSADYVYKLDPQGNVVSRWGGTGFDVGQFQSPSALAIYPDGDVAVGDRNNHRVQVSTPDGEFVRAWDLTADPGVLADVTIDSKGRTYVTGPVPSRTGLRLGSRR
jgi:hypothetical protein